MSDEPLFRVTSLSALLVLPAIKKWLSVVLVIEKASSICDPPKFLSQIKSPVLFTFTIQKSYSPKLFEISVSLL